MKVFSRTDGFKLFLKKKFDFFSQNLNCRSNFQKLGYILTEPDPLLIYFSTNKTIVSKILTFRLKLDVLLSGSFVLVKSGYACF